MIDTLISFQSIPDEDLDVVRLAMAVAMDDSRADTTPDKIDRVDQYLRDISPRVRARRHDLIMSGADDDARTDLAALKHVLVDEDDFGGDPDHYNDPRNANMIDVIDRRRGLPVALACLYVQAGTGAGITVRALDFPGHVVIRVERGGQMIMADPFVGCMTLDAADLRALIKRVSGPSAELRADYYAPLSRRGMVIRLQNNIKLRLIEHADYAGAIRVLETMRVIDPDEYRVLFDLGVLYEKLGEAARAVACLTDYLDLLPPRHPNRREAQDLLEMILNR